MTYYTLPKLFKYNNTNIIDLMNLTSLHKTMIHDDSFLEQMLNTFISKTNTSLYDEIKTMHSFTDLLNIKIPDEIYHPKTYFAFIEINKISKIFEKQHIVSLHMSNTHDYLDALFQLRKGKDRYIYMSEKNDISNSTIPSYIGYEQLNSSNTSSINRVISKYNNTIDLICINYDDIKDIIKNLLLAIVFQKESGNLIIKIKRLNNYITKEIIYILMSLYDNVLIIKPKIVNSVNEYKYIVAEKKKTNNLNLNIIRKLIYQLSRLPNDTYPVRILQIELPQILVNKIDECELIMSENTLSTHMKILNSIHLNNVNLRGIDNKNEKESRIWLKENII